MANWHRVLLKHRKNLFYAALILLCLLVVSHRRNTHQHSHKFLLQMMRRYQNDVDGLQRNVETVRKLYKEKPIREFYMNRYDLPSTSEDGRIHIAIASCSGKREEPGHLREAQTFLKSAIFNNPDNLHFHIFTTDFNRFYLSRFLATVRNETVYNFKYTFYNKTFPDNVILRDTRSHKKEQQYIKIDDLFRPCSAQRLYMPWALESLSKVIYIDTDCLVLGSLDEMWRAFKAFNTTQYFAMAPIAYHATDFTERYNIPNPGNYGFNAGVALMDLTKIRQNDWRDEMLQLTYRLNEVVPGLTDQTVLNVYFSIHREAFYEMSCSFNYRKEYCEILHTENHTNLNNTNLNNTNLNVAMLDEDSSLTQECSDAEKHGALILHGVFNSFSSTEYFVKYVFDAYKVIKLGEHTRLQLKNLLQELLLYHYDTQCSNIAELFYKRLET